MKPTVRYFLLIFVMSLGLSQSLFAEEGKLVPQKDFNYEGQASEMFKLSNAKTETRYKEEQVASTCTRKIPYTENVCSDETFYRQECREVPGYQNCYNVTDQECRSEPRTRNVCERSPGRNVCRRAPSREQCRTEGERTCRTVPGREVCRTNRNTGERVCRNMPSREVCSGKPRRVCRTVLGDETCRWVAGERTCRDVTSYEQVCRDVSRRQCDWVDARQECTSVPYTQNVCRDVTLYRTETYACMETIKVPYTVTVKNYVAELNFEDFKTSVLGPKAIFKTSLNTDGEVLIKAQDQSEEAALILAKKKVVVVDETEQDLHFKAFYKVNFVNQNKYLGPLNKPLENVKFTRQNFTFVAPAIKNFSLNLKIEREDNEVIIDRELKESEFTFQEKDSVKSIHIELKKLGIKNVERQNHKVYVEFKVNLKGQVINEKVPEFKKTHQFEFKPSGGLFFWDFEKN